MKRGERVLHHRTKSDSEMNSDLSHSNNNVVPLLVQSPDLRMSSQLLVVNPKTTTLGHLKLSLFPTQLLPTSQILDSLYFSCNGKLLSDSSTLLDSRITTPFSNLILRIRAVGGGGDGGSTCAESRDCYLNMYSVKKPDKVDPNETRLSRWTTCSLSFEPLKPPCVIDRLGNVFNKEPLVEALLGKKVPREFGHIKGLKDMIRIHLSEIPLARGVSEASDEIRFQCPITGLEFNGKYKFVALRGCGHVLSVKAMKEVQSSGCLVCHGEVSESEKIVINGSAEEVAVLREKMEADRASNKLNEKKEKKMRVNGTEGVAARLSGTKHSAAEKVVSKSEANGKLANAAGVDAKSIDVVTAKRLKPSVVAPPNANKEVYASIFTSSRKSDFKETYSCRSLPLGRN